MGRNKKYHTKEEKRQAGLEAQHRYYLKNKKRLDEKAKEYYRKKKNV